MKNRLIVRVIAFLSLLPMYYMSAAHQIFPWRQAALDQSLALAVGENNIGFVKVVLSETSPYGIADVNAEGNSYGDKLLHIAVEKGYADIVKELLAHKADINSTGMERRTPLMAAIDAGRADMVALLMQEGLDINKENRYGTALHYAVRKGDANIVSMLLKHGADVNAGELDKDARTPLMLAASGGKDNIVELLINAGAHIDVLNKLLGTALQRAIEEKHVSTARLLIRHHANVNLRKSLGTPLMSAVEEGLLELVPDLIAAGADQRVENREGQTAYNLAQDKKTYLTAVDVGLQRRKEYFARQPEAKRIIAEQPQLIPEINNIIAGYTYGESSADLPADTQGEKRNKDE